MRGALDFVAELMPLRLRRSKNTVADGEFGGFVIWKPRKHNWRAAFPV